MVVFRHPSIPLLFTRGHGYDVCEVKAMDLVAYCYLIVNT